MVGTANTPEHYVRDWRITIIYMIDLLDFM